MVMPVSDMARPRSATLDARARVWRLEVALAITTRSNRLVRCVVLKTLMSCAFLQDAPLFAQPLCQLRRRAEGRAGAGCHGQVDQAGDVAPIAPGAEVGELIGTQQPHVARVLRQRAQRVDGIGGAASLDFDGVDRQPGMAGDGQIQHGAALFARGVQRGALPGIGGGNELHLGQPERLQGVLSQRDMRDVDGVEAAAQEANAFQTQSRGFR